MRRRTFIAAIGGRPLVARAQQSGKIARVGILWHGANEEDEAPFPAAFRDGLTEFGYVEGKTLNYSIDLLMNTLTGLMPSQKS